jgi:hypothetical protein
MARPFCASAPVRANSQAKLWKPISSIWNRRPPTFSAKAARSRKARVTQAQAGIVSSRLMAA